MDGCTLRTVFRVPLFVLVEPLNPGTSLPTRSGATVDQSYCPTSWVSSLIEVIFWIGMGPWSSLFSECYVVCFHTCPLFCFASWSRQCLVFLLIGCFLVCFVLSYVSVKLVGRSTNCVWGSPSHKSNSWVQAQWRGVSFFLMKWMVDALMEWMGRCVFLWNEWTMHFMEWMGNVFM